MNWLSKILTVVKNVFVPQIENLTVEQLSRIAVLCGKAFGPDGIRHFSELSIDEQNVLLARVPVLATNHIDWPTGLNWVPRWVSCFVGPQAPIITGNTDDPKPIPDRGKWFVSRGYFASTSNEGLYIRCGFRFDDVDFYYTFPSFKVAQFK